MHNELFGILDTVESTNNYAIEKIKQGFGINGKAWFAKEQWGGRGQRGKSWKSESGKNIILSVIVKPNNLFIEKPFYFSALVASVCRRFVADLNIDTVKIKWPNDIYINDRKAGGILIESIYKGNEWQWAVIGIGINVNQLDFEVENYPKTSILKESNIIYDPLDLGYKLYQSLIVALEEIDEHNFKNGLRDINTYLFKKNELISFLKESETIEAEIILVNENGQLEVEANETDYKFNVGEVEIDWLNSNK